MCGMTPVRIPIVRVGSPELPLPEYFSADAAGMDLGASLNEPRTLAPGEFGLIPCGFAIAIPEGFEAQVRPRSGLASKHGVTVLNAPGTIDSDYRGEVKVLLINHGAAPFAVVPGMRIAQLVIAPVSRAVWDPMDALPPTRRGAGGFGHTGA
jgi:dUTP pyrophosphatase